MERKEQEVKEKSKVKVNNFCPNLADLSAFMHLVRTDKPKEEVYLPRKEA